jgi:uncharacterized protein YjbI with pentapeptide repeats/DNA-binding NarL/FixJ family response regulator
MSAKRLRRNASQPGREFPLCVKNRTKVNRFKGLHAILARAMVRFMKHPSQLHSGGSVTWTKVRLLVFSLDDAFRFLCRSTFRKLMVREVQSTSVPADATPMLAQGPDAVLVDLGMEPDQGLAFLERVRQAEAELPVLVLLRPDDKELVAKARALGIEGVIPKPVSGHELSHRVAEAIVKPERLPPIACKPEPKPKPVAVVSEAEIEAALAAQAESEALDAQIRAATSQLGAKLGAPPAGSVPATARAAAASAPPPAQAGAAAASAPAPVKVAAPPRPSAVSVAPKIFTPPVNAGGAVASGAPRRPSSGTLADDDLAPLPAKRAVSDGELEVLESKPKKRNRARDEAWEAELAGMGRKKRKGGDVAAFDVTAVVADHAKWLETKGAEGKRANLESMDLAGCDVAGVVLANGTFKSADLSDARMCDSRFDGADFRYAVMEAADISGANLGVASLRHAKLRLANLNGANLRGADLSGAALAGAKLEGADFTGATLVGTDLADADLSKADGLNQAQLDKSLCSLTTKLPPGLFRPAKEA